MLKLVTKEVAVWLENMGLEKEMNEVKDGSSGALETTKSSQTHGLNNIPEDYMDMEKPRR